MGEKNIGLPDFYASVKRIECLLEEILFRQIAYNSLSQDEATETFKMALKNVNKSMEENIPGFVLLNETFSTLCSWLIARSSQLPARRSQLTAHKLS